MKGKLFLKRVAVYSLCVFLAGGLLSGCGTEKNTSDTTTESESKTRTFTDSAGREVEVPTEISRVVPSGSMAQIVLFALAPDSLIGVSGEWSSEAQELIDEKYLDLPDFGQFYGVQDFNPEELLKYDPEIIIDVGESKDSIVEDMDDIQEKTGVPTVHIEATTATMDETYTMLGDLLGLEKEAEELADYCRETYDRQISIMEEVGENKKTVLYCLGTDGKSVIAKGSYHAEILDLVANNAAEVDNPSSKGTGNEVNMEQIMNWNPDVILFAPESIYDTVKDDSTWNTLTAIQTDQYYEVPYGPYNWMGFPPSVQRYLGMMWMTSTLYPEYCDYDLQEEVTEYFELFYHCQLTDEQYQKLVTTK